MRLLLFLACIFVDRYYINHINLQNGLRNQNFKGEGAKMVENYVNENGEALDESGIVIVDEVEETEEVKRKAGRPKGTPNRRKVEVQPLVNEYFDIFDYTHDYITKHNEAIKFRISQGGTYLSEAYLETGAPHEKNKIYLSSWEDLRKRFGPGIYTVVVLSINRRCSLKQQSLQIAPVNEDAGLWDSLTSGLNDDPNINQIPQSTPVLGGMGQKIEDKIFINIPKQKSFGEVIKEVMPVIAPFMPLIMEYFKNTKRVDPYEEQKRIEEKIERERQRMIDAEERFERKANDLLREKLDAYLPAKESSFADRIGNILETATATVLQNPATAKILTGSKVIHKPIIKPKEQLVGPPILEKVVEVVPLQPEREPIEPGSEKELELIVNFVQKRILGGMDMIQLGEYIKKNQKILDRFSRHSKNSLVSKAKTMIELDQGTWGLIEEQLEKLYVFIFGTEPVTSEQVEGESKPSEILQVQA